MAEIYVFLAGRCPEGPFEVQKSRERAGKLPKMPMDQKPSPLVTAEQTSNENHSVGSVKNSDPKPLFMSHQVAVKSMGKQGYLAR
jgi:hypothetical protein